MITVKSKDPMMIANNLKPYKPTHPGEVLKDELEFRGISQRGLAKKMGISYSALNEVSYIAMGPCPMQEVVPSAVSAAVSIDTII